MVMRVWPARVNFSMTYLLDQGAKDVGGGGEMVTEHCTVTVEGLCADAILRKIKDHYRKDHPEADFKFGHVVWFPANQIGKVALSF